MQNENLGNGANISPLDPRTVTHILTTVVPYTKGGITCIPSDIEHQHNVGICTAISFVQLREKAKARKYSPDFQYLLQKKYYDQNWNEGSAIFWALKVGKNFGLLPAELWTHTTEQDRYLSYTDYIAKLQAIPDSEIQRLIGLCVDKIPGYASVNVNDPQAIAGAIMNSEAGILCRYDCGSTWWLPSWLSKDINPLRKPIPATSGHAIMMTAFDYTNGTMQKLANTWGALWNLQGNADINWDNYKMTEAWTVLRQAPVIKYVFAKVLAIGARGVEVEMLQKKLSITADGKFGNITLKAVKDFQTAHGLTSDGIVGKLTNEMLNKS